MKREMIILLLPLVLLVAACSYPFELGDIKVSEKLVLYSFPGTADTTLIHLSRSIPVQSKSEVSKQGTPATIQLLVDGVEQTVFWNETATSSIPEACYYTVGSWNSEAKVELYASHPNLPAISSHTVIPNPFPLEKIELKRKPFESNTLQFHITFSDDAETSNYYGVRIERKEFFWYNTEYSESCFPLELELKDEPLLNEVSGLDEIFLPSKSNRWQLYYWDDSYIQGRSYTLRLNTNYRPDYDEVYDDVHSIYKNKYRITLYSLSEPFYLYLENLNEIENNKLGNSGLSPILPSYTNVKQGIGVLGGARMIQTDWLDNI
ncbi:MAG: DUF4249 domain-containing protein [Phocaeicola sp.]